MRIIELTEEARTNILENLLKEARIPMVNLKQSK